MPRGASRIFAQYDTLYGISSFVASVMAEATGRDVQVVHHGIWPSLCPFRPAPSSGPVTFVHLGQVDPRKATDLLFRAFVTAFPRGNEDVRLLVKCGKNHSELAHEWWRSHGKSDSRIQIHAAHIPRAELSEYFHQAHAVVMPSRCEGFGMVGLEALAHGRMPILTGWSGPADYVSPNDCAILPATQKVPAYIYPGHAREPDFDALVEELRAVAQNLDAATAKGLRGRARVIEDWTWPHRVGTGYLGLTGGSKALPNTARAENA